MSDFKSSGQAGQDAFAYQQIGADGTFLDIGSNDPFYNSNSLSLEQMGWRGLAVDFDAKMVELFRGHRRTPVLFSDATQVDWKTVLTSHQLGPVIDYLSLDIDGRELLVLQNLVAAGFSFRVITVEHDAYDRGDSTRAPLREYLLAQGYTLAQPDVCWREGSPFEDWWTK
jgi:hypothetical protein